MAVGTSVKLFEFNQKCGEKFGIKRSKNSTLNAENVIFIVFMVLYAIVLITFLVKDASTMDEYGSIFYTMMDISGATICYSISLWKLEDISTFTKNCEKFIEKRKYDSA